jgi:hypothetical protein
MGYVFETFFGRPLLTFANSSYFHNALLFFFALDRFFDTCISSCEVPMWPALLYPTIEIERYER